jgi:CheY-like chemotaxis protein
LVVLEALFDDRLSGLDLARKLAKDYPKLPLIMITSADERLSKAQKSAQDRDGWLPVARYLEKPVMEDVLVYEVEHLLAD